MRTVHLVVPAGIDDPARPSGGNVYDRRLSQSLGKLEWVVHEHAVTPTEVAPTLAALPAGEVVLVDGLIATAALVPESDRLRIVVLLHMPVGDDRERAVLNAVSAVVTTSDWARRQAHERATVARPGVDRQPRVPGSASGRNLLCVGAVVRAKGQDVLVDALAKITHLDWHCTVVGALDLEPGFVEELGKPERVHFTGPLTGERLDEAFAASDLLVSASRSESYGMAVTEALARGIPVITTDVGGLPEAVGTAPDGSRPGLFLPVDDPGAWAEQLGCWLGDEHLRERLRSSAAGRRTTLGSWTRTAGQVAEVLARC